MEVPSVDLFKSKIKQNKLEDNLRKDDFLQIQIQINSMLPGEKLDLEAEKTLEDAKENYNGHVAFKIDQRIIMVPHAIEPITT